jgi:hypothetical protein
LDQQAQIYITEFGDRQRQRQKTKILAFLFASQKIYKITKVYIILKPELARFAELISSRVYMGLTKRAG